MFVDRPPIGMSADSMLLDNYGGARTATEHLIRHGHHDIALVGGYGRLATHQERLRGFAHALNTAGIADLESSRS